MRTRCLLAACFALAAHPLPAQDGSAFRPGRLVDILDRHRASIIESAPADGMELVFAGDTEPTAVDARFAGQARPIAAARREFIAAWAESRDLDPHWAAAFTEEWLFRADTGSYWLAVQGVTGESMRRVVREGTPVRLSTRWLGARVDKGVPHWIFVVVSATSDADRPARSDPRDRRRPIGGAASSGTP